MSDQEHVHEFKHLVNMSGKELEHWLQTEHAHEVGWKEDEGESVGHASGRRIVELLGKRQYEYTEDDIAHMRKVVAYIKRHTAQRPTGDVEDTRWRYSLMNWGHDPLK